MFIAGQGVEEATVFYPKPLLHLPKKERYKEKWNCAGMLFTSFQDIFFLYPKYSHPSNQEQVFTGLYVNLGQSWSQSTWRKQEELCVSAVKTWDSTSGRYKGSSESLNSQKLHRVKHASGICCYCNIDCLLLLNIIIIVMCTLQDFGWKNYLHVHSWA